MTLSSKLTMLGLMWLTTAACYPASECDLYARDVAGRGKADWTHIVWRGAQTIPQPLIWLSHARLKISGFPETNLVFSKSDYRAIEMIHVTSSKPLAHPALLDRPVPAFRFTQRIGYDKPVTHILTTHDGCRYLAAVLRIANRSRTAERRDAFLPYAAICGNAGVPFQPAPPSANSP